MADGKWIEKIGKFKYPLLILVVGVVLLLLPTGAGKNAEPEGDARLQQLLASTEGIGDAYVLISENGVVVVCEGAENAKVRLDIIRAVGSYTGFGSDKITILKLADQ